MHDFKLLRIMVNMHAVLEVSTRLLIRYNCLHPPLNDQVVLWMMAVNDSDLVYTAGY